MVVGDYLLVLFSAAIGILSKGVFNLNGTMKKLNDTMIKIETNQENYREDFIELKHDFKDHIKNHNKEQ